MTGLEVFDWPRISRGPLNAELWKNSWALSWISLELFIKQANKASTRDEDFIEYLNAEEVEKERMLIRARVIIQKSIEKLAWSFLKEQMKDFHRESCNYWKKFMSLIEGKLHNFATKEGFWRISRYEEERLNSKNVPESFQTSEGWF